VRVCVSHTKISMVGRVGSGVRVCTCVCVCVCACVCMRVTYKITDSI